MRKGGCSVKALSSTLRDLITVFLKTGMEYANKEINILRNLKHTARKKIDRKNVTRLILL